MVSALVTCAATIGLAPRLNTLAASPSYTMNNDTQSDVQYILPHSNWSPPSQLVYPYSPGSVQGEWVLEIK